MGNSPVGQKTKDKGNGKQNNQAQPHWKLDLSLSNISTGDDGRMVTDVISRRRLGARIISRREYDMEKRLSTRCKRTCEIAD
jgi:hypothetical protein